MQNLSIHRVENSIGSASPLSIFGEPRYWNPAFTCYEVVYSQRLFISEFDFEFITEDEFQFLRQFLTGEDSFGLSPQDHAFALLIANRLEEKGVLITSPDTSSWYLPGFLKSSRIVLQGGVVHLSLSDGPVANHALIQFLIEEKLEPDVSIVIVDDLLDPRLRDLPSELFSEVHSWIPVAMKSHQILVGPVLKTGWEGADLHFETLKGLAANREIEQWCLKRCRFFPSAPQIVLPVIDHELRQVVKTVIVQQLRHPHKSSIKEICRKYGNVKTHWIPGSRSGLGEAAFSKRNVIVSRAGGYRTCGVEETLDRINEYVSPLTGIVKSIKRLNPGDKGLHIYGASFARPPKKDCLLSAREFEQYTLGKGVNSIQSKVSALSEAIERKNSIFKDSKGMVFGRPDEIPGKVIQPPGLKYYSANQYREFRLKPDDKHSVEPYDPGIPLHWAKVKCLCTGESTFVPASFCYSSTPFEDEKYIRFNSNGCAAGNTVGEAIIQGFLELIERDAVAIWWYNRIQRPGFDLESFSDPISEEIKVSLEADWDYWLLDITTDFEIPCLVAVGMHRIHGHFRFGFAAHFNVQIAAERALTELYQLVVVGRQQAQNRFDQLGTVPFLIPKKGPASSAQSFPIPNFNTIDECIAACIDRSKACGFDTFYLDTTSEASPLHTVKVIQPGLCFFWPEFGNPRLYRMPYDMGWTADICTEKDLNPISLFV